MRLGNSRAIADIEFVIDGPSMGSDAAAWKAFDADCSRNKHRFLGDTYSFAIDVVHVRYDRRGKLLWHVAIVSEVWQFKKIKGIPRGTKSLKLITGKSGDVLAWLRHSRDVRLASSTPHRENEDAPALLKSGRT